MPVLFFPIYSRRNLWNGEAFEKVRDNVIYQIHFGANYESGPYGWTTNLETIKKSVAWQLKELKEKGIVKHIGISSHTPRIVEKALDTNLIDMVIFSINPGYDYHQGDYANGSSDERTNLYKRCESECVGISVMKPFSGGQLLDGKTSPFGKKLTRIQCIQYALDRPGVLTVLPGIRGKEDLKDILKYVDATPEEKDYSIIGKFAPADVTGKCVYRNHCMPCPMKLDIGLINKYYDLTIAGDKLAKDHYMNLEKTAKDCISCGHCNNRCPFGVDQISRMKEIKEYFGK